jgi:hypothetical protein
MRLLLTVAVGLILAGCGDSSSVKPVEYATVMDSDQQKVVAAIHKYADCLGAPPYGACSAEFDAVQTDLGNQIADIDRMATPACVRDVVPRLRKALSDEIGVIAKVQAANIAQDGPDIDATLPAVDRGTAEFTALKAAMDKASC